MTRPRPTLSLASCFSSLRDETQLTQGLPVEHGMPDSPVILNQSSAVVVINSTSPIKNDSTWIRPYNLSLYDQQVIKSGQLLNNNIIYAVQCLLPEQSER